MTEKDDRHAGDQPPRGPRVFVVDDDDAVRESVVFLLESVGLKARSFASAEDFLRSYDPKLRGCVVLDVRMPGMSGLQLHKRLREQNIKIPVIIMTAHSDVPMAVAAMREGAFDLIEKPYNDQVLIERIQEAIAHDSETRLDDEVLREIESRLETLSPREREVFELVVAGYLNKQIAKMLEVSIKTIEVHRSRVMHKMKADSLADLVRMAMKAGID